MQSFEIIRITKCLSVDESNDQYEQTLRFRLGLGDDLRAVPLAISPFSSARNTNPFRPERASPMLLSS